MKGNTIFFRLFRAVRALNDTLTVLQELQSVVQFRVVQRDRTHHNIRVTVDIFGHRIQDNIRPQLQRFLEKPL